jgi:zinc protease
MTGKKQRFLSMKSSIKGSKNTIYRSGRQKSTSKLAGIDPFFAFGYNDPAMRESGWERWRRLAALGIVLFLAPRLDAQEAGFSYFTLDNGLRVILQEKRDRPLSGITLAVDAGAPSEPAGRVHLLEHLLLFGATRESGGPARLDSLRAHGALVNAHTDSDLMTFECACPAAETGWTLEQLRQQAFMARLDAGCLETEKRIIQEEIAQVGDDPGIVGQLQALRLLFGDHAYARPVEGEAETVGTASLEEMERLRNRLMQPKNCVLAVVGDFTVAAMEPLVRQNWNGPGSSPTTDVTHPPPPPPLARSVDIDRLMDVQQSHLFIAWRAPGFNDPDRVPFDLLVHILGRGLNPLLSGFLRDPRHPVERVEMSYFPMRRAGAVLLHLTLPERSIRSVKTEISRFFGAFRSINFTPRDVLPQYSMYVTDLLESARNQMAIGNDLFRESAQNLATGLARFFLLNENSLPANVRESAEKVNSGDLRRMAGAYFTGKKWVSVAVVPVER